jgi:DNA-binding response OmpR family regulator
MELGADGYVTKPVMIDELENVIKTAFQKRS